MEKKNSGLILRKDASKMIIPYKQNIEISFEDGKTIKEGILFNVSLNTIYLKIYLLMKLLRFRKIRYLV